MKNLSSALSRLESLTIVNLNFSDCKETTDVGIKYLFRVIKRLKSLSVIDLSFPGCTKLTNKAIKPIISAIKNRTKLSKLSLSLANQMIDDEGLEALATGLVGLQSLQSLHLDLSGCRKTTDIAVEKLLSRLKEIKTIQSFVFGMMLKCRFI